jgi:hypothetical protein
MSFRYHPTGGYADGKSARSSSLLAVLMRAIGDVVGQPKQECAGGQRKQGKIGSEDEWVQRVAKCVDPFEVGAEEKDDDKQQAS